MRYCNSVEFLTALYIVRQVFKATDEYTGSRQEHHELKAEWTHQRTAYNFTVGKKTKDMAAQFLCNITKSSGLFKVRKYRFIVNGSLLSLIYQYREEIVHRYRQQIPPMVHTDLDLAEPEIQRMARVGCLHMNVLLYDLPRHIARGIRAPTGARQATSARSHMSSPSISSATSRFI
jgi:hypothetical protein